MPKIYEQHRAAFANVSAYVIIKDGERVATIAFKFPKDGAGRLYAYAHWIGLEMVRGFASGGGYDKRTAACADAGKRLSPLLHNALNESRRMNDAIALRHALHCGVKCTAALAADRGPTWESALRDAGFTVFQAV